MLVDAGSNVKARRGADITALYFACAGGHVHIVRTPLAIPGFWVDGRQGPDGPPIAKAILGGHLDCVKELVEHGAKTTWDADPRSETSSYVNAAEHANRRGEATVLEWLLTEKKCGSVDLKTMLQIATHEGFSKRVIVLLEQGATATSFIDLKNVAARGEIELLEFLLRRGATQAGKDRALGDAAFSGQSKAVRILLDHGADPNTSVNVIDPPLHCAVLGADLESAKMLVRAGSDVFALNNRGQTAARWARRYGEEPEGREARRAIAEYLESLEQAKGCE